MVILIENGLKDIHIWQLLICFKMTFVQRQNYKTTNPNNKILTTKTNINNSKTTEIEAQFRT